MATKAEMEAELAGLKKTSAEQAKELEQANARIDALKAEHKQQVKEKSAENVKDMKARLDAEDHQWVQVFNKGLKDGVDFGFTYEGIPFKLYSGNAVSLPVSVIKHLKGCGFPVTTLKQGEAGQGPVKVHGRHHNFNVVNCEPPSEEAVKAAG